MSKFFDPGSEGSGSRSLFDMFVKLTVDQPTIIQILEPTVTKEKNIIWRHYIPQALRKSGQRGIPIVCPGKDVCPVCQKNATLPDRKHPDFIPSQKRVVVNVLDLSPVKECELCHTKNTGKECTYCGYNLTEVAATPTNEVKLLERGTTLFAQLAVLEETQMVPYDPDDSRNDPEEYNDSAPGDMVPAGITRFPITIVLTKSGDDTIITPVPGAPNDLDWRDYQDKLLDPKASYIILNADEIRHLLGGGSLSEVMKARNAVSQETASEEVQVESQSAV